MRDAFIRALTCACETNPDILLVVGDLGFGVLDDFRERFPERFYNVGVAEQNLSGVAAGLALVGHTVFTYSIGNFPTLRCLEQIRNDVCYHNASVKIVTIGGGMAYGALGPSHFATEDLGIMRMLPGMAVVAPGDPHEVTQLIPQIVARKGPVYVRLGRAGEPVLHHPDREIVFGVPTTVRSGKDVVLMSTGGMLGTTLAAADALRSQGISAGVVSVHTLRPLPEKRIRLLAAESPLVVTVEEHSRSGGLGGAVAEILAEMDDPPRFRRFGLDPVFPGGIGSQEYLRHVNGIDEQALVTAVQGMLHRVGSAG